MIIFYNQIKILISFLLRQRLNFKFLIQLLETLTDLLMRSSLTLDTYTYSHMFIYIWPTEINFTKTIHMGSVNN